MAQERLSMRKIREILRLKFGHGLTNRAIARSVSVSRDTVREYLARAATAELGWPLPVELDDAALGARLFPKPERDEATGVPLPDWPAIHRDLKRKGVTRRLLWEEYRQAHPDGYGYSRFCQLYDVWQRPLEPVMRLDHKAGEGYVDYSGLTMPVIDPESGELFQAEIFVFALGASSYIYAEPQTSQSLPNWIGGHVRTFEHLGGVPSLLVPDNLRAGVKHPSRYEPELNPTYHDMAVHYGTAVVPARVRKPRDKAKVESAVQVVERWVLAPLRDIRFFGLEALGEAMDRQLDLLNDRVMRHVGQSRRALFQELDRPALLPLPEKRFEFAGWKNALVGIDYHVEFDGHYYSVPHRLIHQRLAVRATATTIEVFSGDLRVAAHVRSHQKGKHSTLAEHMPERHRAYAEWSPERFTRWADTVGPETRALLEAIFGSRVHPEQGYRTCLGLMRLAKSYPKERFEAACRRARVVGHNSYRGVANILKAGLEAVPLDDVDEATPALHDNIRGASYYGA